MKPRGWSNLAALGHQELTRWGDRCQALGIPTAGPLARVIEEGVVGASIRPGGTHSDPTLAAIIRDEPVYDTDKAVLAMGDLDPDGLRVVQRYYIQGEHVDPDVLWSKQNWVGSWLLLGGKIQGVVDAKSA